MFEEVDARKRRLDAHRPFSDEMLRRLDTVFEPWFIYGSNAIEGNTFSLADTIEVVLGGRLPTGKSEEEYWEVKGQQAGYSYLHRVAREGAPLTEKLIREFHKLLTERLPEEKYHPGTYKTRDNQVRLPDGSLFPYVSHVATPAAVEDLVGWYGGPGTALHPVERAAHLHYRFILIHPFLDGNGRTARLLTSLALLRAGYVAPVLGRHAERKRAYLQALRAVDSSVPQQDLRPDHPGLALFPFVAHVEEELLWSLDRALDVVEGRLAVTASDLVERLSRVEENGIGASRLPADQEARLRALSESVERLTREVDGFLRPIAEKTNLHWRELRMTVQALVDDAASVVGSAGSLRRRVLEPTLARGKVGLVHLEVVRSGQVVRELAVPRARCEFLVAGEPHALTLAGWLDCDVAGRPTSDSVGKTDTQKRLLVDPDPAAWKRTEIEGFVLERMSRFAEVVERELKRLNA